MRQVSDHLLTLDVHPQSQPAIKAKETVYYAWRTVPHGVIYGGPGSMCAPPSREVAHAMPFADARARVRGGSHQNAMGDKTKRYTQASGKLPSVPMEPKSFFGLS